MHHNARDTMFPVRCARPLALAALCAVGLGSEVAVGAGWYMSHGTDRVQIQDTGAVVAVVKSSSAQHECGSRTLQLNNPNALGAAGILSMLLAAQAQERRMQFYIVSCSSTVALFDRVEDCDATSCP